MQLTTHELPMSDMAPDLTEQLTGPPRLRFWEINDTFKCPVVGWCLDMGEQREILRKEGICVKGKSDFKAHTLLVGSLQGENRISRRLDLWLNRKYRKEFKGLSGLIFGDVHMEMHVRAAEIGNERQKLDKQRERSGILSARLKEANRRTKTVTRKNERLQKELTEKDRLYDALERKNREADKELSRWSKESTVSNLERENKALQEEAETYSEQISELQMKLTKLQERNRRLLSKLSKQRQLNSLLLKDLENRIDQLSGSRRDAEHFLLPDLSQMRTLIVGGLPKMESLYRRLIEERGGMFEYHNGHMSGGIKGLENQLRRADMVLCPIDYNSHAATLAVKRLGKKHRKPVRMLANSSLSTVSQELSAHQGGNGKWRDKHIE